MSHDLHDPADVAEAEAEARAARVLRLEAWRWLLDDARGRMVIADLLRETGFPAPSFAADERASCFLAGQRAVGHAVYAVVMDVAPALWPALHRAAQERA